MFFKYGFSVFVLVSAAMFVKFSHRNTPGPGSAIYTAFVIGYFLIGAKVWRLREFFQRDLIQARFALIFS
jgi:hypothetical protein